MTIDLLDMGLPQTNLLKNKTKQNSVKHRKMKLKKQDMHVDNSLLKSGNIVSSKGTVPLLGTLSGNCN